MCLIVFCNAVFSQSTSKICTLIRFTLFSNGYIPADVIIKVLLPYRFTLFSNKGYFSYKNKYGFTTLQIYTILKLRVVILKFFKVLLPYRFTLFSNRIVSQQITYMVLLPYRFTLFSNNGWLTENSEKVLLPYRFTLFSNR